MRWYLAHDRGPLPHLFRVRGPSVPGPPGQTRAWIEQLVPAVNSLDPQARAELASTAAAATGARWATTGGAGGPRRLAPLLDGIGDPYLRAVSHLVMAWTSPITGDFDGDLRGVGGLEQLAARTAAVDCLAAFTVKHR